MASSETIDQATAGRKDAHTDPKDGFCRSLGPPPRLVRPEATLFTLRLWCADKLTEPTYRAIFTQFRIEWRASREEQRERERRRDGAPAEGATQPPRPHRRGLICPSESAGRGWRICPPKPRRIGGIWAERTRRPPAQILSRIGRGASHGRGEESRLGPPQRVGSQRRRDSSTTPRWLNTAVIPRLA